MQPLCHADGSGRRVIEQLGFVDISAAASPSLTLSLIHSSEIQMRFGGEVVDAPSSCKRLIGKKTKVADVCCRPAWGMLEDVC